MKTGRENVIRNMNYLCNFLWCILAIYCMSFSLNVSSQLPTYTDRTSLRVNFQTVVTFKIVDAKCKRTEYLDLFTPLECVFWILHIYIFVCTYYLFLTNLIKSVFYHEYLRMNKLWGFICFRCSKMEVQIFNLQFGTSFAGVLQIRCLNYFNFTWKETVGINCSCLTLCPASQWRKTRPVWEVSGP